MYACIYDITYSNNKQVILIDVSVDTCWEKNGHRVQTVHTVAAAFDV